MKKPIVLSDELLKEDHYKIGQELRNMSLKRHNSLPSIEIPIKSPKQGEQIEYQNFTRPLCFKESFLNKPKQFLSKIESRISKIPKSLDASSQTILVEKIRKEVSRATSCIDKDIGKEKQIEKKSEFLQKLSKFLKSRRNLVNSQKRLSEEETKSYNEEKIMLPHLRKESPGNIILNYYKKNIERETPKDNYQFSIIEKSTFFDPHTKSKKYTIDEFDFGKLNDPDFNELLKSNTLKGKSKFFNSNNKLEWRECTILNYNPLLSNFTIEFTEKDSTEIKS